MNMNQYARRVNEIRLWDEENHVFNLEDVLFFIIYNEVPRSEAGYVNRNNKRNKDWQDYSTVNAGIDGGNRNNRTGYYYYKYALNLFIIPEHRLKLKFLAKLRNENYHESQADFIISVPGRLDITDNVGYSQCKYQNRVYYITKQEDEKYLVTVKGKPVRLLKTDSEKYNNDKDLYQCVIEPDVIEYFLSFVKYRGGHGLGVKIYNNFYENTDINPKIEECWDTMGYLGMVRYFRSLVDTNTW